MEQRISWWIVSSGERGEIVKRPTSGLIVSGISNWPVAISREETGSTTGSLPSTIPPPPFSLSLSLSLSRCPLARRLLDSSRELPVVPSSSASRRPLSFFLPLGQRSRSTFFFFALATSLYVAFQCLRGELYCDCEHLRRTSTKQASISARGPLRCLTVDGDRKQPRNTHPVSEKRIEETSDAVVKKFRFVTRTFFPSGIDISITLPKL